MRDRWFVYSLILTTLPATIIAAVYPSLLISLCLWRCSASDIKFKFEKARASIHSGDGGLAARSCGVSKPWDSNSDFSNRSQIWQAPWKQRCLDVCHIAEWHTNYDICLAESAWLHPSYDICSNWSQCNSSQPLSAEIFLSEATSIEFPWYM